MGALIIIKISNQYRFLLLKSNFSGIHFDDVNLVFDKLITHNNNFILFL